MPPQSLHRNPLLLALAANPTYLSRPPSKATSFRKPSEIPHLGVSICPLSPEVSLMAFGIIIREAE